MNLMKGLKNAGKAGLLSLFLLTGCGGKIKLHNTFENYPVTYFSHGFSNVSTFKHSSIAIYSKNKGAIIFYDENGDKRFDNMYLGTVEKGDPIEKFANLETGQRILNSFEIDSSSSEEIK